jgi:hypothetical protein
MKQNKQEQDHIFMGINLCCASRVCLGHKDTKKELLDLIAKVEQRAEERERDWWTGNLRLYNGEGVHAKDRVLESIVVERKSLSNQQEKEL